MIENILNRIVEYNPSANVEILIKAYNFAEMAHSSAPVRKSGERYFVHPYNVALLLCDMHMDIPTIVAGLLHDVVEDTGYTYDDIKREFSEEIADMVDGVTKLSKVKYRTKEERQAESLRKMIIAMSKDIRIIIIKLADRLHNIRTLEYMPLEKQKQVGLETLEIYAPIANRLGMASLKWELEDTSLKYIDKEGYEDLVNRINTRQEQQKDFIKNIVDSIEDKLSELNLEIVEVKGRGKSLYSIYKKMYHKNKSFEQIYDITAVRIIMDTVRDCYGALGAVHTMWKPIPGRFKDYVAMPKPNRYQSIHTTVIASNGEPFEIQIRTLEMHRVAEFGIAAHWKYKEGVTKEDVFDEKLNWLREMLEWEQETNDPQEFMENLKVDLYSDEVFVFTPSGEVINLPVESTPIDFAYRVHSAVGNKCVGAKVNGKIVPINYKLKMGDKIEILTSANSNGPSRDWLKFVASSQAKTKIRKFFKEKDKDFNVEKGRELLEREVKKNGFTLADLLKEDWLKSCADKYNLYTLDNLYAAISIGTVTESQIFARLKLIYKEKNKDKIEAEEAAEKKEQLPEKVDYAKNQKHASGILIRGVDNVKIRLSRCCNPVPGDAIVGFITRGRGVSVHRADCTNINELNDSSDERFIEVEWNTEKSTGTFLSQIQIIAVDRPRLLQDITGLYNDLKVSATSLNLRINKEKLAVMDFTFEINDSKQIHELTKKIKRLEGVLDIYRTTK